MLIATGVASRGVRAGVHSIHPRTFWRNMNKLIPKPRTQNHDSLEHGLKLPLRALLESLQRQPLKSLSFNVLYVAYVLRCLGVDVGYAVEVGYELKTGREYRPTPLSVRRANPNFNCNPNPTHKLEAV
jgi:hypothetical protein